MRSTATMHRLRQERKGTVRHPCRRHNFVLTLTTALALVAALIVYLVGIPSPLIVMRGKS